MTTQERREMVSMPLEDAAPRLGMSVTMLRRRCQQGRIEAFQDGRRWYVTDAGIRRYLSIHGCDPDLGVSSAKRDAKLREAEIMLARALALLAELRGD